MRFYRGAPRGQPLAAPSEGAGACACPGAADPWPLRL